MYAQVKFASYTNSSDIVNYTDETSGELVTEKISSGAFDTPFVLGIGADFRLFNDHFLTLSYGEIVSIFLNNNDNFPLDLRLGYKFKL